MEDKYTPIKIGLFILGMLAVYCLAGHIETVFQHTTTQSDAEASHE